MHFGYLTGNQGRRARIWQNIDDSQDNLELSDVPTLTINNQPTYMFSGGVWTLSKVILIKTQTVTQNVQQFQYTREVVMKVVDHPIQQLYRVLPDGTPLVRVNRILHQDQVVKTLTCSMIQIAALLNQEVPPKNILSLPQQPVGPPGQDDGNNGASQGQ